VPDYNDNICRAKLNQRLWRHSMPAYKTLTARSLAMLNEAKRQERMQGHLFQRIVIPCKQDASTERYEFISKVMKIPETLD
ncbi:unnamed protein product, partial [Onchocerca ochengi]|uniref:Transposase n=1 Tax=Onchocerca ochengi TaxID=42157 RepID=A0A182F005_ONCOC